MIITDSIEIRHLAQDDAVLYRHIRLQAHQASPEAFGSTFEVENAPLSWFSGRLGSSTVLGAFRDAELVGIAGFAIQQGLKELTKACSGACTFALPQGRPRSVADLSRRFVISRVNRVSSSNSSWCRTMSEHEAIRDAALSGVGVKKNALKQDGRYYDEVLMAHALRADMT